MHHRSAAALLAVLALSATQALGQATTSQQMAKVIKVGDKLSGTLGAGDRKDEDGDFYDVYQVALAAGDRVTVEVTSVEFDPFVQVHGPDGARIGSAGAEGDEADFHLTAAKAGLYTIIATREDKYEGDYDLNVRRDTAISPDKDLENLLTTPRH